ncbi:unnamed protein product [Urochloa humidicola]
MSRTVQVPMVLLDGTDGDLVRGNSSMGDVPVVVAARAPGAAGGNAGQQLNLVCKIIERRWMILNLPMGLGLPGLLRWQLEMWSRDLCWEFHSVGAAEQ